MIYSVAILILFSVTLLIFENTSIDLRLSHSIVAVILLLMMTICLIALLSFRLDLSTASFLERRVRSKLKLMNETLGDTLHDDKQ